MAYTISWRKSSPSPPRNCHICPTGARLTPAGERVVALSRRVLSETRELMAGVEALVAEESSHLRVAASLTVAEYLLPGWLAALHRKSPDASCPWR